MSKDIKKLLVQKLGKGESKLTSDDIAVEEALQIKVKLPNLNSFEPLVMTMRTPGQDEQLAIGFLNAEGFIYQNSDIDQISFGDNEVLISLNRSDKETIDGRNTFSNSSCGVCSKESLEDLEFQSHWKEKGMNEINPQTILSLPEKLRAAQEVFDKTGGLHASALFTSEGEMVSMSEDIGRHNALDKLIGDAIMSEMVPLGEHILLLSGRISYELVQKAIMAGIKVIAAIGAPSSLAVDTAEKHGLTLIGFVKNGKGNVYCGHDRLQAVTNKTEIGL